MSAEKKVDAFRKFGGMSAESPRPPVAEAGPESLMDQARRLLMMSEDDGQTWDLSDNDRAACRAGADAVLAALAAPPPDLVALVREWKAWKHGQRATSAGRDIEAALLAYPLPEGTTP